MKQECTVKLLTVQKKVNYKAYAPTPITVVKVLLFLTQSPTSPNISACAFKDSVNAINDGAMVDVEAVERMKAAQKAAQETNRIEAAEQLKAIATDAAVNAPIPTTAVIVLLSETQSPISVNISALALNRIEAAEQLKAIRAQPPRKMPWQQKPISS
jgi:hypothetical protein